MHDPFISGLLKIFQATPRPSHFCSINRSDYLVHQGKSLLQVEFNTISVAFVAFSQKVAMMHQKLANPETLLNSSLDDVVDGLEAALKLKQSKNLLMIVNQTERNTFDQDILINYLNQKYDIKVFKASLSDVANKTRLLNGKLYIGEAEIGLVYYRAGYTDTDYPTDIEWNGRLLLEFSDAIKCPDIGSQLAGSKKIQQELCNPGVLERFLKSSDSCERLRSHFTNLYSLDAKSNPKLDQTLQEAIKNPNNYVLKPQREGGGNNLYGEEMVEKLKSASPSELAAYILMDLIVPIPLEAVFIRSGSLVECMAVSELGIYGVIVCDQEGHQIKNKSAGYLLRTKSVDAREGGVASGYAVLDSLILK